VMPAPEQAARKLRRSRCVLVAVVGEISGLMGERIALRAAEAASPQVRLCDGKLRFGASHPWHRDNNVPWMRHPASIDIGRSGNDCAGGEGYFSKTEMQLLC
jgi:hypothetical protein